MGKGGSRAPKPPDPYETAAAEAQFNRVNTYNADGGGQRYGYVDESGTFQEGTAPEGMQSAVRYQESDFERAMREALQPASMDLTQSLIRDNSGGNMPGPARVRDRSDVASDLFNRNYSLMADDFERENSRMLSNLQARGIPVGSEAFNDAYGQQQESVNEALARLSMDANLTAGQEQTREFGLDSAQRSTALQEMMTALGGGTAPATPQANGNVPGINYSGMVNSNHNAEVSAANSAQQRQMGTAQAIGSLGSALIKMSDRRLKTDIVQTGHNGRLPTYSYRYIWDRPGTKRHGYMAQDILKIIPDAVKQIGDWLAVDYSKVPEVSNG